MSIAKQIIQGALRFRGSDSSAAPADTTLYADAFPYLLGLIARLETEGITTGLTVPVTIDDELAENVDVTLPLISNLAVSLLFIRKPIDADQYSAANIDKINLSATYGNAGVIPQQLFPTTTPKGEGNFTSPWRPEFFSNPDAVLNNQNGVITIEGDC